MVERRVRGEQRGGRGRRSSAAGDGTRAGRKGRPRGRRSQRMVWKEALGRRSKLSPSCSGCSSLSSNEFAEPFMAPLPARPVPSLSSVRCRPASSRKFLTFPSGNLSGLAAGTAGRGGGPGPGWGCCPGEGPRGGGSPALPALGRAGQGRAGGAFLSFLSPRRRSVRAPATLGQELLEGSRFRLRGPRGDTCLWS